MGEGFKYKKLPSKPLMLVLMLLDGEPLLKENSMLELLVWIPQVTSILKLLLFPLLLQVITVKFLLLLSPFLVMSKTVVLKDKKLSKLCFVQPLLLLVEPLLMLLIDMVVTVKLLVLSQLPVLEEDSEL